MAAGPSVIQGGMGVAVSSWRLAAAVARCGQLGVVSGTALDTVIARRLQDGDGDGTVRTALAAFPAPDAAARVLEKYYRPGGRGGRPYRPVPKLTVSQTPERQELAIVANFVEVWLAKQGHSGAVGINFLERIQMATPAATFGAMLAGVDFVLMGAGIPRQIPQLLTDLAAGRRGRVTVDVAGAHGEFGVEVDPVAVLGDRLPVLRRAQFLAVVSHSVLAAYLARDPATCPDGFVVEGPRAGGHNAPARGRPQLDAAGQPVYGPRDAADLVAMAGLGLPFWLAGGYATPQRYVEALASGAQGVQVGSVFALADESGLEPALRERLRIQACAGTLHVRTDPHASPTGFPFKIAELDGTLSDPDVYAHRPRSCDLSYLRTPYLDGDRIRYRCSAEPVEDYIRKSGTAADAEGTKCLCNALVADIGLGQTRRDGYREPALATLGADLDGVRQLAALHPTGWSTADVLSWLTTPAIGRQPGRR
jgi:NAD(P)H-dependent flavin oxidoreductase YrpB (nitropropane dioxygenase family)